MIELQALSKVLLTGDITLLTDNGITKDNFVDYLDEYYFIINHFKKYGNTPVVHTFMDRFPKFELINVTESNDYIIAKLHDERLFRIVLGISKSFSEKTETDGISPAMEYLRNAIQRIPSHSTIKGEDIVHQANNRLEEMFTKVNSPFEWCYSTGFEQLDLLIDGIHKKEEFIVLFARTSHGKSWVAEKMAISIWEQGYNVGYFSPEMSPSTVGYRFDTLYKNFSNSSIMRGKLADTTDYEEYTKNLVSSKMAKFLVTTPKDFDRRPTVSKLKSWVIGNNIQALFIDGLSYLADERMRRGDNATTSLTNISEDLMDLSVELEIPIIGVVQANREAVSEEKELPSLENIRNSDGIAHNASRVITLKQGKDHILMMAILKNRYGRVGNKLLYKWDIDNGTFFYVPNKDSGIEEYDEQFLQKDLETYTDIERVF